MAYELTGKLFLKEETNEISDKFKKRDFVVLKEENNGGQIYTDHVKFQLTQDKCDLINGINLEDEITVSFNIRGNKWEKDGKTSYFTNLDAWRIVKGSGTGTPNTPPVAATAPPVATADLKDDLPF